MLQHQRQVGVDLKFICAEIGWVDPQAVVKVDLDATVHTPIDRGRTEGNVHPIRCKVRPAR